MKELVVATHNAKKGTEMVTILGGGLPDWRILTLADFEDAPEPEETGDTYEQNAVIKAESAAYFTDRLCLADDAGLEIDAMPGEIGVWSKRFAGETTFEEKMALILDRLQGLPAEERKARFVCWVALAEPGQPARTFHATCEGVIATEPSGTGGFGYDPIFFLPDQNRTMADLTPEEKHAVSHRGKVLAQVIQHLSAP